MSSDNNIINFKEAFGGTNKVIGGLVSIWSVSGTNQNTSISLPPISHFKNFVFPKEQLLTLNFEDTEGNKYRLVKKSNLEQGWKRK